MSQFTFKINFSASTLKEAETKIQALTVLSSKLTAAELDKLADIVKNDPIKTAMAKSALGV
jgi:hypothetical protein